MNLQLADKTALVIAASKGIGKGVALALAREGCRVLIASRNADNLAVARREIEGQTGGSVEAFVMDVRSAESVARAAAEIHGRHPRVDILVTNGPGPRPMAADALPAEEFQAAVQANLHSAI